MKALRLILPLLAVWCGAGATLEVYENTNHICDVCTCVVMSKDCTVLGFDLLDCSGKGVHSMIGSWPAEYDTVDPDREIVLLMSGNKLNKLQQLPATNTSLVFTCRHCELTALAGGVFLDTANILRVDLSYNQLTGDALTADVFRGPYNAEDQNVMLLLDELDLSSNAIAHLQEDAFQHIGALRVLSLARNPLGKLAGGTGRSLEQLTGLTKLDLSYAELTEIDETVFGSMRALEELYIAGNRFTVIPDAIYQLGKLRALQLSENPIEVLDFVRPLERLTELNASNMPVMRSVQIESFRNVKLLSSFIASNNSALEVFDLSILQHVPVLGELDLSGGNLKHLHTPSEKSVSAQDEHMYDNDLEVLLLYDNPWHCDCNLQQVLRYVHFESLWDFEVEEEETRCETPHMLTAMPLDLLVYVDVCDMPFNQGPNNQVYEKPAFLRPGAIFLSLLSVAIVVGLGIVIGLVIVCLKRRLTAQGLGFVTSPVRYTSVRDSTTSAVYQQQ